MPTIVYGLHFKQVPHLVPEHWRVYDSAQREVAYVKVHQDKVVCWSTKHIGRKKLCITPLFRTPEEKKACFEEIAAIILMST